MVSEVARKIADGIFGTDEENYRQRVPCVIVMDCSSSMEGTPIAALNEGLKKFEEELKADEKARRSARIMLIRVGGFKGDPNEVQIRVPFQDAREFSAPREEASGTTPLGEAVILALQKIDEEKTYLRSQGLSYHRPWLFVMSDGKPNEGPAWTRACAECLRAPDERRASIFPIAIDSGNPNELDRCIAELQKLSTREVQVMEGVKFSQFFVWLSNSMGSAADTNAENPSMAAGMQDWTRA